VRALAGAGAVVLTLAVWCVPAAAATPIDRGAVREAAGADAHAAYQLMHRWPSRTITFHNRARKYARQVEQAAALWNRSGARVRWRAVPRGRARVSVQVAPRLPTAGQAMIRLGSGGSSAVIYLRPDLFGFGENKRSGRTIALGVIAHEMGHVMGLGHEVRRCAMMNPNLGQLCRSAKQPWRYRCRVLEADDVRGGVRLFGGRVRKPAREFCDLEAAPLPVEDLRVMPDQASGLVVSWRNPERRGGETVEVMRAPGGACASGPRGKDAVTVATVKARPPGTTQSVSDFAFEPGEYCYWVTPVGAFQRPGKVAGVRFTYNGEAPSARFGAVAFGEGYVEFRDSSSDPDDEIVSWSWSFGDGSTSTDANPSHVYAAPGDYTVTLTVTDARGNTDAVTEVVSVQ
jgi:PKD domain